MMSRHRFYPVGFYLMLTICTLGATKLLQTSPKPDDESPILQTQQTTAAELLSTKTDLPDRSPRPAENTFLESYRVLKETGLSIHFRLFAVGRNALSPSIVTFLGLSPSEVESCNASIEALASEISQLRLETLEISYANDGAVLIVCPPVFHDEDWLKRTFVDCLSDALSPEQLQILSDVTHSFANLKSDLRDSGLDHRTYKCAPKLQEDDSFAFEIGLIARRGNSQTYNGHWTLRNLEKASLPENSELRTILTPEVIEYFQELQRGLSSSDRN